MKKYVLAVAALALLAACSGKKAQNEEPVVTEEDIAVVEAPEDAVDIHELLIIQPDQGDVVEQQYAGTIPATKELGASYLLTLYYQQGGDGGVYGLTKTYLNAEEKDSKTEFSYGKREVIQGAPFDANAVVYKLIPATGGEPMYFWVNGTGLTKLDNEMKKYDSPYNYTLDLIL